MSSPVQRWGVTAVTKCEEPVYFVSEAPTKRALLILLAGLPTLKRITRIVPLPPIIPSREAS